MRKIILRILFIFICDLTLFSSCSLDQISSESPEINKIKAKEKFRVNLSENHSSGYIWQLSESYNKKIVHNINNVWHGNKQGVDFNFDPLSAGQTTLTFIKRKHNDTSEIKHFIIEICDN